jgi:HAD superfamily hydrolase (TIGR01484 family)
MYNLRELAEPRVFSMTTPSSFASADLSSIRLIATDIDGTVTNDHRFSSQLLIALERLQAAKVPVIMVTGRSAGWVEAIANYLPVMGAIAENGGCYFHGAANCELLGGLKMKEIGKHREKLADHYWQLQGTHSQIKESLDNRCRLTDWTFDLAGLEASDLWEIKAQCDLWGMDFTYSTIQCHLKLPTQSKATGIQQVLKKHFPTIKPAQVLTIGDSPNDAPMLDPEIFPNSVGVANIQSYLDNMEHQPAYITEQREVGGFVEMVDRLLQVWDPAAAEKEATGLEKIMGFIDRSLKDV